ncbi:hypothetical protein [Neolewinella xylanilytica]|nr:hypothetical protein [Neolewinella xylanilytica]
MINQTLLAPTTRATVSPGSRFVLRGVHLLRAYAHADRGNVRRLAQEYLQAAELNRNNRDYGNAIHQANTVLGLLELEAGNVERAESYLVASAQTPGSPQLAGMGPNMMLAKRLLEHGRVTAVLNYLTFCGKLWKLSFGRLWKWKLEIRRGRMPDFGANLTYLLDPHSFG